MREEGERKTEETEEGTKMKANKQKNKNPKKGDRKHQDSTQPNKPEENPKTNDNEKEEEKDQNQNEEIDTEPITEREQLSKLQRQLTEALLEIITETKNPKRAGKTLKAIEKMTNLTIKLIEENAYNRGKIEGLNKSIKNLAEENSSLRRELENKEKTRNETTYAAILGAHTTTPHKEMQTVARPEDPKERETRNQTKEGLLIYSKETSDKQPFLTVKKMLGRFTPQELGLKSPELKPIRGGAIILSEKKEGLQTLMSRIEKDPETKNRFEVKMSAKKKPADLHRRSRPRNQRRGPQNKTPKPKQCGGKHRGTQNCYVLSKERNKNSHNRSHPRNLQPN